MPDSTPIRAVGFGGLLGRGREAAVLTSLVETGRERGSVLLMVGQPGIGKSALLGAARGAAVEAGYTVLSAVGVESEMHLPFCGVQQVLAPLTGSLAALPAAHRDALETALGLSEGSSPDLFLIAQAAFDLLAIERRRGPVMIVVDDVQWLDPQSARIMTFLAHRSVSADLCVVGAIRADHPGPFTEAGFPELAIDGVDDVAASTLLRAHAGGLGAADLRRIRREALGNPLALLELPRSWGTGPATDAHPPMLSARLEHAFAGRVAALPAGAQDGLLIAAVSSSHEAPEILAALSAFGTAEASAAVFRPAVSAGLITQSPSSVEFRHPLVRSGVLQRETMARRHAAHHALAEVLTAEPYRRTWHRAWSLVGPRDDVADELAATVPDSLRRGAVMSAVSSLERSAQLTGSPRDRGRRLLRAAGLAFGTGRPEVVARLLREAGEVDLSGLDHARLTWLTEALNDDIHPDSVRVRQLCDSARRAVELADAGLALDLLLAAALRCWWSDSGQADRDSVTAVLDGLTGLRGDPRHLAAVSITEPVTRASEVTAGLAAVALETITDADSLRMYGMAAYGVGDFVLATDLLDRAEQLLRDQGRLGLLPVVLALQLHIRLDLGDWSGAAAASDEVNTVSVETGQALFAQNNVLVEGRGMALRGEWRPALELIAGAEAEAAHLRVNDRVCLGYQARGAALLSAGRPAEAFEILRRQYDPADRGYHLRESFAAVALMAEAAVDCGRAREAAAVVEVLETVAVLTPSPLLEVNLLYARAVLAPAHECERRYRQALDHDLTRWPWMRARIQLEYGRWLAGAGREAAAVTPLRAARDYFDHVGAARWHQRAAAALSDALRSVGDRSAPRTGLIGRDAEITVLRHLIGRIRQEGASVIVRGEPGVGKSSVLRAADDLARDSGALVLRGSGIESETMRPFTGLRQVLGPLLDGAGSLPRIQRRALLAAFGQEDGPPPQLFLIALAALTLIVDAATKRPVVLVADDVQWLDAPTNDVLAFVARRIRHDHIVLVVGLRDGHTVALSGTDAHEIVLSGLDDQSSRRLLDTCGDDLTSADRAAILSHARGNPLALVELPAAWRSAGAEVLSAVSAVLPLSARLERAFAARIQELPAATRDALLIAAVNAEESLAEILAGTTNLAGRAVTTDVLEPAQAARLITFDEVLVRFRHPLVRSGVLSTESPRRRRAAHTAMGQALRPESYRRVWHQAESVDGTDDAVADRLEASHSDSIARGSVVTAVAALERSAQLSTDSRVRGRRLLLAARHAFALGRADLVNRLVDAAEENDLPELDRARVEWLREIFSEGELGDSDRIMQLCEFAARAAHVGRTDLALDLLASAALRSWWAIARPEARARVISVAESLSGARDDSRCIAAIAIAEPLAKSAQTQRHLTGVSAAMDADQLRRLGMAARAAGADVQATDYFDAAESKLREHGQLGLLPHVLAVQAAVCIDLGDWRRTARSLAEASRLATETGQPNWRNGIAAVQAVFSGLTGDTEDALRQSGHLADTFHGRGANDFLSLAQMARGAAYLSADRPADAYAHLTPMFDSRDPRYHPRESLSAVMLLAEAAARCGKREAVQPLLERLTALAATTRSPVLTVQLLYAAPVLATDDDAERLYRIALDHDLTRWPWPRARIQLAYGDWLRRQRRPLESRLPLRAALGTFQLIGATRWAAQARSGLRAAGELDAGISTGESELLMTAQEMQIALLAAQGLSNREIGQQLYLSPRTIGSHLYRIYPKLGIRSRTELAVRLRDS